MKAAKSKQKLETTDYAKGVKGINIVELFSVTYYKIVLIKGKNQFYPLKHLPSRKGIFCHLEVTARLGEWTSPEGSASSDEYTITTN